MNFPFYIAKRYIVAKKSHNAINLISFISVLGIAIGTMALIVLLSVFNGFDNLVQSLFTSFYPDLKITPAEGKVFVLDPEKYNQLKNTEGILFISEILEDNVLIKYGDKQSAATLKGVDEHYRDVTHLDQKIDEGNYILETDDLNFAVLGRGLAYILGVNITFVEQCKVFVPRRLKKVSFNPNEALKTAYIIPGGIFTVEPEIDFRYLIVPVRFARLLFEYPTELSSLEIKTAPELNQNNIQSAVKKIMGEQFVVKNRIQQNELIFKTMKAEKWAIFFILAFILIIASFNIIGSLTMLIIEKKDDINTLQNMGTNLSTIKRIFITEGVIITILGGISGLLAGLLICFLQMKFGFVKPPGNGELLLIDSYPVAIRFKDVILVLITVLSVGFFVAWYPIRYVTRNFINRDE